MADWTHGPLNLPWALETGSKAGWDVAALEAGLAF